jgi:hypothetical protein
MKKLKLVGYFVLGIMILNLVLFACGVIDTTVFWGVIIIGAIFAWKIVPKLRQLG